MDWQPIETAPLCREIKLRGEGFVSTGILYPGGGYYLEAADITGPCVLDRGAFTHWQPLPEPPAE